MDEACGRFITLEGGEGTGKSTQTARLVARLAAAGIDALATREPGGAPGAEDIRRLLVNGAPGRWQPMTEALLHFAARKEHVDATIAPALASGRWVVSDRFTDSTMAYQGLAQGLGRQAIETLGRLVLGDFKPDLTLVIDLPPAEGLARAGARPKSADGAAEDRYERMGDDFHARLRAAFLEIAAADPARCQVIDGRGSVEEVEVRVWQAVSERFGL